MNVKELYVNTRNFQTYTTTKECAIMRNINVLTPSFIYSINISLQNSYSEEGAQWEY